MPVTLENNRLCLQVDSTGPIPHVRLLDKRTELQLEAPLVEMEMLWSPIQRIELQKDINPPAAARSGPLRKSNFLL